MVAIWKEKQRYLLLYITSDLFGLTKTWLFIVPVSWPYCLCCRVSSPFGHFSAGLHSDCHELSHLLLESCLLMFIGFYWLFDLLSYLLRIHMYMLCFLVFVCNMANCAFLLYISSFDGGWDFKLMELLFDKKKCLIYNFSISVFICVD